MSQHLLTHGPLLNESGELNEAGYAFSLVKEYKRSAIKKLKSRIKEWDYYFFHDDEYGVALTIADNSYMALISISVIDFKNKKEWTKSYMKWFTRGSTCLPYTSEDGDIMVKSEKYDFTFKNDHENRHLSCTLKDLIKNHDFHVDVSLSRKNPYSMVIATPFKKKRHFYYNQKINLLHVKGSFSFGPIKHAFKAHTYGVLDWGRGIWTYSNTWYWSSLSGNQDGHLIGFNLGYGFGDTSRASENMLFVDDKAYKLEDVKFDIPVINNKEDYLQQWKITSSSSDINLTFTPLIDRYSNTNALIIQSKQHQVFGKFSGTFKVKDQIIKIKDMIGFAEKVKNRW